MALEHVTWEPYGTAGNVGDTITFNLNPKCLNEAHLWHMRGPMICVYAVEWHLPHRVMKQFGLYQETPPKFKDTSLHLHSLDKIKKRGIKNWPNEHSVHIKRFLHKIDKIEERLHQPTPPPAPWPFDTAAFNRYLVWFRSQARTQLNPPAFARDDILLEPNLGFDQMANMEYNKIIRNGRWTELAPIVRFAQNELSKHVIEAREALKYPPGEESYRALRAFAERSKAWARGVGALLGCRFIGDVVPTASRSPAQRRSLGPGTWERLDVASTSPTQEGATEQDSVGGARARALGAVTVDSGVPHLPAQRSTSCHPPPRGPLAPPPGHLPLNPRCESLSRVPSMSSTTASSSGLVDAMWTNMLAFFRTPMAGNLWFGCEARGAAAEGYSSGMLANDDSRQSFR
ncbi:hypothetical protein ACQ4PT_065407 [Festuca glaucescens]